MKEIADDVLADAYLRGDAKAFELLFLRYQPRLVYFVMGFVKDEEASRDICQDIFLRLWQSRESMPAIQSFKSLLFSMARHAICNYYDHHLIVEKFKEKQLLAPVKTDNAEEQLFADQLQELINSAVEAMPAQRRRIFKLSRAEGLSNSEIASMLDISKRTVENHLTLALAELRKAVKLFLIAVMCV
jgi:RNA polymerase sigma-70 factor (ECF subfamily)